MQGKIKAVGTIATCSVAAIISLVIAKGDVKVSADGLEIIGNAEGCRRDPYKCSADVWTQGIGDTHNVMQKKKTDQEIADDWNKNILIAEQCVIRNADGKNLPQGAFDAAVSAVFNMGCGAMAKSTMFRYFRQGEIVAACNQFPRWIYVNGVKSRGLELRRQSEMKLCLKKA